MQSDSPPGATPGSRPLTLTEALARFGDAWAGGDGPRPAAGDDLRELRCPGAMSHELEARVTRAQEALATALQAGAAPGGEIERLGSDYRHACAAARPDQNWWTGWADAAARDATAEGWAR